MVISPGPAGRLFFTLCKVWVLAFPALWWLVVERRRLSWSRPRHGGLLTGAILGVAIAAIIAVVYATFAASRVEPTLLRHAVVEMGLDEPGAYIAAAAYWIFVNSVIEEYAYRWFIFLHCERLFGGGWGVIASALVFTAHHVIALQDYLTPSLTALASLGIFIGGATWSWCYLRYRSIWPGWISHGFADIAVFAIGWHLVFGTG
jgi:membrane protease YdiL (CAAX protease family)